MLRTLIRSTLTRSRSSSLTLPPAGATASRSVGTDTAHPVERRCPPGETMKLEFAPLNIPLARRLQTAAVLQWILTFVLMSKSPAVPHSAPAHISHYTGSGSARSDRAFTYHGVDSFSLVTNNFANFISLLLCSFSFLPFVLSCFFDFS